MGENSKHVLIPSSVSSVLPECPHVYAWWSGPICARKPADPCRPEILEPAPESVQTKNNNKKTYCHRLWFRPNNSVAELWRVKKIKSIHPSQHDFRR